MVYYLWYYIPSMITYNHQKPPYISIYIYRDITIGEINIYNIYIYIIEGFSSNIAIFFKN